MSVSHSVHGGGGMSASGSGSVHPLGRHPLDRGPRADTPSGTHHPGQTQWTDTPSHRGDH